MKNASSQLWSITTDACILSNCINRETGKSSFPGVRVIFWPNMKPCWPVNMYMISLLRYSRTISTVNTYASNLSIFIRFLFTNNINIFDMNDDLMYRFRDYLISGSTSRRKNNQVNKILSRTLAFLFWYQEIYQLDVAIVSHKPGLARIRVHRLENKKRKRGGYYHRHACFLPPNSPREVKPVSRGVYVKLLQASEKVASSTYVRKRTRLILLFLANTAVRRSELVRLKERDVYRAIERDGHKILIQSSKARVNDSRYVPIPPDILSALKSFIEIDKKILISKLKKSGRRYETDYVFLTVYGSIMSPESITQNFAKLRRIANLSERATAHMLRHRWITIVTIRYLKSLSGGMLSLELGESMLTKIASMTGHKSINSLWVYVDLAFEELGVWDEAERSQLLRKKVDYVHQQIKAVDGVNDEVKEMLGDILNSICMSEAEYGSIAMGIDSFSFRN